MAVRDILRYNQIARAGQPVSLTGEGIVQLGALFSQMDFGLGEKEEEESKDSEIKDLSNIPPSKFSTPNIDIFKEQMKTGNTWQGLRDRPVLLERPRVVEDDGDGNKTVVKPNTMPMGTEYDFSQDGRYYGPAEENEAYLTDYLKGQYRRGAGVDVDKQNQRATKGAARPFYGVDYNDLKGKKAVNDKSVLQNFQDILSPLGNAFNNVFYNLSTGGREYKDKDTITQRKTDSPLDRIKQDQPEIYNSLQAVRYTNKGDNDSPLHRAAHVAESPFVKTDNVDYRMMKRATMPGYAQGRLGAAAAEGYNLVIDKYNYDQAVKADYDREIEDQMGSLNVEADFINEDSRKAFMDFSFGLKKELADAFNDYTSGKISKVDYENIKAGAKSRIDAIGGMNTNLATIAKEFAENKGTYDIGASKKEIVDFYNTLSQNPESFTVKTIDGADYFVGKTLQNKEIKVSTAKLANGAAGFRLVKKANIAPVIGGALKAMNSFEKTVKTNFGYGTASASPEKAKEIGVANIKASLAADESQLRSLMSQIYGAGYDSYENFLGDNPEANREEMLNDAAEHLYETRVKSLYFPQEKTTRFVEQKPQGGKLTAKERQIAAIQANFNKLGNITESNYKSFLNEVPGFQGKYRAKVKDNMLIIADAKSSKVTSKIDLSNPTLAKQTLANLAGVSGYRGQTTDLSQYNFDIQ